MQKFSFYYRDSFDLSKLFPNALKFSLLYPDSNIVIEGGVMRLLDPYLFNPLRIHNIVRVYIHDYDYFKIEVSIRCWREDSYSLKEITKHTWVKSKRVYKLLFKFLNHIHHFPYNTLLYSDGKVSYFSNNNRLVRAGKNSAVVIGKMPQLLDPIYYEFLPYGEEAFLRTGKAIYISEKGMTLWRMIYEGKRAIKESMLWIEEEKALLFSEYSPGMDLSKHNIYKYYVKTGEMKTVMSFYSPDEHKQGREEPYCRHIHVLKRDLYTNDIYLGVGDSDDESAIFRSIDNGNSFSLVGSGDQSWRTLSFFFTEGSVFWNTDSPDPQYLSCISRTQLSYLPIQTQKVKHWPLFNSACWNTVYDTEHKLVIMSSSCEGALYDNKYRVYGVSVCDDVPVVFSLFEEDPGESISRSFQLFLLGIDDKGRYFFYDTRKQCYRQFVLNNRK